MASYLFRRYVWLLEQVNQGGKTYKEISRKWEVAQWNDRPGEPLPKRTLHNHITAIEDIFGLKIKCHRQGGNRYVLEGKDGERLSEMQRTLLDQLLLSNIHLEQKHSQYVIMPKMSLHPLVTPIFEAISLGHKIKILWGREYVEYSWVEIAPYYVKGYNNDFFNEIPYWYLFGKGQRGCIQVYALENIKDVELLDETFEHPQTPFEEIEHEAFHTPINQTDEDDSLGACGDSHHDSRERKKLFDE